MPLSKTIAIGAPCLVAVASALDPVSVGARHEESCYGGVFIKSDMNAIAPHQPANTLMFCGIVAQRSVAGFDACSGAVGQQIAEARRAREQACNRIGLASAVDACRKGAQL